MWVFWSNSQTLAEIPFLAFFFFFFFIFLFFFFFWPYTGKGGHVERCERANVIQRVKLYMHRKF